MGRSEDGKARTRNETSPKTETRQATMRNATVERATFAINLRRAREAAGLSQLDLQARTGFSQSFISDVECCACNPNLDNMARLAHGVGRPLYELLMPKA